MYVIRFTSHTAATKSYNNVLRCSFVLIQFVISLFVLSPCKINLKNKNKKKTIKNKIFTQITEEFEDRRVAEGPSSASGAEDYSFAISQMRSKFKWLKTWKELCTKNKKWKRHFC